MSRLSCPEYLSSERNYIARPSPPVLLHATLLQMTSSKYPTWEILLSGEYPSKKLLLILSNCLMKKQWLDGMDWVGSPVQISVGLKSLTVGSATVGCWFSPNGLCYPVTIGWGVKGFIKMCTKNATSVVSCLHRDKQDQPHSMLVQGPLPILDFGSKSKKIFVLKIFLEGRECWRLGGGCHNWPFSQVTHPPASGHHRLKATIDNCLTTENPADCDFPPESFLPLEKLKLLLMRIYEIQIQILLQGGCWQWLTSHMVKTLEESFGRKFLEAANHFNANPSAATLHSYPTFKASLAMTRWE